MANLETYIEYFARKGLLDEGEDRVVGENSSPCYEIKVAFDGYGGDDGGDKNIESYAMYVHKDSATKDFVFPDHEIGAYSVLHRPAEEVCIFYWYNVAEDTIDFSSYKENIADSKLPSEKLKRILELLYSKYLEEDKNNITSGPSEAWPFG